MATIASAPTSKEPKLGRISQRLSATTDEGPCCLMMKLLTPAPLDTPYPGPSASLLADSVPYDDESRMNRREFQPFFTSTLHMSADPHEKRSGTPQGREGDEPMCPTGATSSSRRGTQDTWRALSGYPCTSLTFTCSALTIQFVCSFPCTWEGDRRGSNARPSEPRLL